ncbi:hypothetical protein D3C74_432030 [compost metagenome]
MLLHRGQIERRHRSLRRVQYIQLHGDQDLQHFCVLTEGNVLYKYTASAEGFHKTFRHQQGDSSADRGSAHFQLLGQLIL